MIRTCQPSSSFAASGNSLLSWMLGVLKYSIGIVLLNLELGIEAILAKESISAF